MNTEKISDQMSAKKKAAGSRLASTDGSPLQWRVHTPNLLAEIGNYNSSLSVTMRTPLMILMRLLHEVGVEASRINDPKLNALMCRLTIYSCADPESLDYDPELYKRVVDAASNQLCEPPTPPCMGR